MTSASAASTLASVIPGTRAPIISSHGAGTFHPPKDVVPFASNGTHVRAAFMGPAMRNANCAGPKGTPRCSRRRLKTFSTAALHAQSASAEQLAVASGATTILVSVASSNATHPEYVDDAPGAVVATTSGLSTRNATVTSRTFADGTNVAVSCLHAPSPEAPAHAPVVVAVAAFDPLATGSASNSGTPFPDVVTSSYANPVCGGRDSTRAVTTRCASREVCVDPDEPHRYHASSRYVAPAARDATAPRCARAVVRFAAPGPPARSSIAPALA